MKVVVGLGNPGREYARTRHNLGWLALDALAARIGSGAFRREKSVEAAEAFCGGEKVYLLKPQTYMNLSGQALASWLGAFREIREALREKPDEAKPAAGISKADGEDDRECAWPGLLVLADDVNLELGRMRFRPTGSAGGHNGLADIEKALGGRGYPRLRLGIGAPPPPMDRVDYVLGRFGKEESPLVEAVSSKAGEAVEDWLRRGMAEARAKYNGLAVTA